MARPLPLSEPELPAGPSSFPWFIGGVGSWFTAFGMHGVLFAWLVVNVLELEERWVGITQSTTMLPSVGLVLLGGVLADRLDRRVLLIRLHVLAGLAGFSLAFAVSQGWLSLPLLIGYGLVIGTVQAFMMPARDALLSDVARFEMMRAVTGMNLAQWSFQAAGAALGSTARWIGAVPALCVPPVTLLLGSLLFARIPATPPRTAPAPPRIRAGDLLVGLRLVLASRALAPTFLLVFAAGSLFAGPFMVVFPLLVRDYYGGGVGQIAILSTTFPLGTILGSLALLARGGIRRKGLAQLLALGAGSCCLAVISLGLPFESTLVAVLFWGFCGAIFINAGRTIFQEHAPPTERARVLSTHTLGFMGAAGLVGAPLSGFIVGAVGPLHACAIAAGSMGAIVVLLALFSSVRRIE